MNTLYIRVLSILLGTTLLVGCATNRHHTEADIVVSIPPIKYIADEITCHELKIDVLLPSGAGPESYELTPRQYISLNKANIILTTGLIAFEQALIDDIDQRDKVVNLSDGINLIEGNCSHAHHEHGHHHHGIDPHIWTSPQELKIMARNAYEAIMQHYPDSTKYSDAYNALVIRLNKLDTECRNMCEHTEAKAFVIYHPALTYLSRAYNIEQIAVEDEGKEPSAKHIANIIERAKAKGVKALLYQIQYPRSVVDVIAEDLQLDASQIDPMAENVCENIHHITQIITNNK